MDKSERYETPDKPQQGPKRLHKTPECTVLFVSRLLINPCGMNGGIRPGNANDGSASTT